MLGSLLVAYVSREAVVEPNATDVRSLHIPTVHRCLPPD